MPLTSGAINSALSQQTDKYWVLLMEITHADLAQPIRLALHHEIITSNGDDYLPAAFRVDWPSDVENDTPRVRVAVENVSQEMVVAVRTITSAPAFSMRIVLQDDPDTYQAEAANLTLKNPSWDVNWVTGELTWENIFNALIGREFTPAGFPALFKAIANANA